MNIPIVKSLCISALLWNPASGIFTLGISLGEIVGVTSRFRDISVETLTLAAQELVFCWEALIVSGEWLSLWTGWFNWFSGQGFEGFVGRLALNPTMTALLVMLGVSKQGFRTVKTGGWETELMRSTCRVTVEGTVSPPTGRDGWLGEIAGCGSECWVLMSLDLKRSGATTE